MCGMFFKLNYFNTRVVAAFQNISNLTDSDYFVEETVGGEKRF